MATLLNSESRRLYSWWWDSHISPKNSKWLQDNLTDMDAKVKTMIKLIEEDADSFARRAEMYYKKRPELMKLVEEFYRAYRALAERYDHATLELRHAHKTMAEAFPNQVPPYALGDCSPSETSVSEAESHITELLQPNGTLPNPDDLQQNSRDSSSTSHHPSRTKGENVVESNSSGSKGGLKQLDEIFVPRKNVLENSGVNEGSSKMGVISCKGDLENAGKSETEIQNLRKKLSEIEAEKEAFFLKYQQSLEKLLNLEKELSSAQNDVGGLDERASKAEIEIKILKEALLDLEVEKDAGLLQYNQCLKRISNLETLLSETQQDAEGHNERAAKAEVEAQYLEQQLSRLVAEREASLLQYEQCLEKISTLENKISLSEDYARMLDGQMKTSETEVEALKRTLDELNKEKEAASLQYEQCLEKITKMEAEISRVQEDAKRLNGELVTVTAKLETTEERCALLEQSNHSLQFEADKLVQKIAIKDQELAQKHDELKKLHSLMQEEQSRFVHVENTLHTLQKLHYQSQEEQKALTLELKNGLGMLKDLDICKHGMEEELQQVKHENKTLNDLHFSSTISIKNLENQLSRLKDMKEKLEEVVVEKDGQSKLLEKEILHLREELKDLSARYQSIIRQLEAVGLTPESLESSVKGFIEENAKLKEACEKDRNKIAALYEKLTYMDELPKENANLKISLAELNGELERLREKAKEFQEFFHFSQGEKTALVSEKSSLLSQMQNITENMFKLFEKNTLLENSLSTANIELEGIRAKSKGLEEFCQLLKNERSNLLNERNTLVAQLENIELRLGNLEKRFVNLEEKYSDMENDKDSALHQVEELRSSLVIEKQEHISYKQSTDFRLAGLEDRVLTLKEESRLGKKEIEELIEKAVNAQVDIYILQKFVEDLEENNFSLLIECKKYEEASILSDKLISELEGENLEQQVEVEFLLNEVDKLRAGMHKIFMALQFDEDLGLDKIKQEKILTADVLARIEDLKMFVYHNEEEQQNLLIQNSVFLTLLKQLSLEGKEVLLEKSEIIEELDAMKEHLDLCEKNKHELLQTKSQLMMQACQREKCEQELECLYEVNENLKSEVDYLFNEIKECKTREDSLNLELQGRRDEFELWEAEATSFYFDLQISSVREVLFEHTVLELAQACENAGDESAAKTREIEQLRQRVVFLEVEIGELEAQLSAYKPAITSLRENVESLKHIVSPQNRHFSRGSLGEKDEETTTHVHHQSCNDHKEGSGSVMQDGILDLQKIGAMVKAVEKAVIEEKEKLNVEAAFKHTKVIKSEVAFHQEATAKRKDLKDEIADNVNLRKNKPDYGILMKDIPLDHVSDGSFQRSKRETSDQMLKLWESAEHDSDSNLIESVTQNPSRPQIECPQLESEEQKSPDRSSELQVEKKLSIERLELSPSIRERIRRGRKGKVIERLDSDALQLTNLLTSVRDLNKRMEMNSLERARNNEYDIVERHLKEVEDAVIQQIDVNGQLKQNLERSPSYIERKMSTELEATGNLSINKLTEQAQRGSEKIGKLQFEVQSIQHVMLKLEAERKKKGKNRFSKSKTGILLRDFIYKSGRRSERRKKPCYCGCTRPSAHGD